MNRTEWNHLLQYSPEVREYVRRSMFPYLKPHVRIGDIVNDTLHYSWQHPEQWLNIPREKRLFYLKRIAKYFLLNEARRLRRRRRLPMESASKSDEIFLDRTWTNPAQVRSAHAKEKRRALNEILEKVKNPLHKEALQLIGVEGLSVKEAAVRMGKSQQVASKMFQRGLEICKRIALTNSFAGFRVSGETI